MSRDYFTTGPRVSPCAVAPDVPINPSRHLPPHNDRTVTAIREGLRDHVAEQGARVDTSNITWPPANVRWTGGVTFYTNGRERYTIPAESPAHPITYPPHVGKIALFTATPADQPHGYAVAHRGTHRLAPSVPGARLSFIMSSGDPDAIHGSKDDRRYHVGKP